MVKSGSAAMAVALLLLAGPPQGRAQLAHEDIERDLSHVDELVGQGKYQDAVKILKEGIDRFEKARQGGSNGPYLAYLGGLGVDSGQFKDAEQLLNSAENYSARAEDEFEGIVARERAAFQLERGEYDAALKSANRAYDRFGSNGANLSYLRVMYSRSLAAEAQLALGRPEQAEKLVREALKVVPAKPGEKSYFAPRILYAACRTEAYRDNLREAEELCQRGIAMAERAAAVSRNTVLGYVELAGLYLQEGDLAKAEEAGKKSLDQAELIFGSGHQDAMRALEVLARIERKAGRAEEAEVSARTAVKIATGIFGDGGIRTKAAKQVLNETTRKK